jgi:hypothetical protein
MPRSITFDDGTIIRGETDAELVRSAERHIRAAHPQLAGRLSREEILGMAIEETREKTKMTINGGYDLEGTLLEACTCEVLCPCWIGEDPDGGSCKAVNAYRFERGTIGGVYVSGLNVVRVVLIPGNVLTPNSWTEVRLIDDRASDEQFQAISDVFAGKLGGPLADLAGLVKETLAVERATISHEIVGGDGVLKVGETISATMHPFRGPDGTPTTLRDSLFSTVGGSPAYVAVANSHEVKLPQYGMEWRLENRNAIQSDWKIIHAG